MLLSAVPYRQHLVRGPGSLFLCGLEMGVRTTCAPNGLTIKQQSTEPALTLRGAEATLATPLLCDLRAALPPLSSGSSGFREGLGLGDRTGAGPEAIV